MDSITKKCKFCDRTFTRYKKQGTYCYSDTQLKSLKYCSHKCSLYNKKRHGMTRTKFYRVWQNMLTRCRNKKSKGYKNYGGRGIKVCDRWYRFDNFYDDMFANYREDLTIDRINVNGDYTPENTRWIPRVEQHRNIRRNIWFEFEGEKMLLPDIAQKLGVPFNTLYNRIFIYKFPQKDAFTRSRMKRRWKSKPL